MTQACRQAEDDLVNSLGRLSETAGFSRMIGQIYSLLYLSPTQLSLGEIAEKLGVSKGIVSLNTQNMERMGMIKRFNRPADRRDYYEADPDFWKVIRSILRDREKKLLGDFKTMLSGNLKNVKKSAASDEESKFYTERLKHMLDFLNTFSRMFNAYLALEKFRINLPSLNNKSEADGEGEE
jgi:HTH-type transcriptional regulator, glycine betaine synthesis regulator